MRGTSTAVRASKTNYGTSHGGKRTGERTSVYAMKKAGLTLRHEESTPAGVRRMADALLKCALDCARRPGGDRVEEVHRLRTATKRLRALLQLIRPVIPKAAFEREYARLKTAAGAVAASRDHTVAGKTLKALRGPVTLLDHLHPAEAPGTTPRRVSLRDPMKQAAEELEGLVRGFQQLRIRGEGWDVVGPGLIRCYRQARRRMKAAFARPSDGRFHRWRIRVKHLHYQLSWLEPIWPRRFGRLIRQLRKLEDRLGCDHDLAVLQALLRKLPKNVGNAADLRNVRVSAAARSRRLRQGSEILGAKALEETPRRFGRRCRRHWEAWEARR